MFARYPSRLAALTWGLMLGLTTGLSLTAQAQQPKTTKRRAFDDGAGFYLFGGTGYAGSLRHDSFAQLRRSHDTYQAARFTSPLGTPQLVRNYQVGGGVYAGPLYLHVSKQYLEQLSTATYTNGNRREMRFQYRPLDVSADFLIGLGSRVGLGPTLGMQSQHLKLYSGYRYAFDGRLSYAEDRAWSGIYRGRDTWAITLGGRLDVCLLRVRQHSVLTLSGRAEYVGFWRSLGSDPYLLPFRDALLTNITGGGVFGDGLVRQYLPEDVRQANSDNVYFVGQGQNLSGPMYGWRFSANLILTPFEYVF